MDLNSDARSSDDYFVTALQIFDYCGTDSTGTLRVDDLMDKFAPFVKTNKAEYSYLRSLLDPEHSNPEISVIKLANALNMYSQKSKVDLDESFNLRSGQAPQDSDSGISDGFQLLEDLQCELKEKSHLAHQLRSQLDFTDRQHEEALATLTAERDSLRAHLNMLREENMTLTHVRRDYEDACERLCGSEQALDEARRDLDTVRRKTKVLVEQVAVLETEKLTLQELLTKSKDECHRINEMYASRQSALLEQNETLRTEHADLTARLQDQDDFMQQLLKEKLVLEMELKDMLNRSNQISLRMDRSIEVSYTEDQMLSALDSLNADSRFSQDSHVLDEESFINALKGQDFGRSTNLSLFDEIRLSFSASKNISDVSIDYGKTTDNVDTSQSTMATQTIDASLVTVETQTEEISTENVMSSTTTPTKINHKIANTVLTQTEFNVTSQVTQTDNAIHHQTCETQTDDNVSENNNYLAICNECNIKCIECERLKCYANKLENDVERLKCTLTDMNIELDKYEENLNMLQHIVDDENKRNKILQEVVEGLESKLQNVETACLEQGKVIKRFDRETCFAEYQTDCETVSVSTQVEVPCRDCEKRNTHRGLKRYLWRPLKSLFQIFAVVCFLCALSVLYGVTRRSSTPCSRDALPWRWFDAQDILDLLLRIEYVSDVPM